MKSLVFLRPGATLAEYEMSYVSLLRDEFALQIITVGTSAIGGTPVGVTRLHWPDELANGRSLLNGFYSRVLKRRYHLPGLGPVLKGAAIVQAGEAASEYSYQAARLKDRLGFKLILSASENCMIDRTERVRHVLDRTDHAFAINRLARERLIEAGLAPEKITVIGHGIDCERFIPARHPEEKIAVGYCGRFRKEKGLSHLITATRGLDLDLHLLGEGPEENDLRQSAHDRVIFHPPLPYSEMHRFYQSIDLFVLPSVPVPGLVEQFGFVLLEAMASGVPIIASAIGGIPEVVGSCAVLVPPGDETALSGAISELAADPSRRKKMSAAGVERARTFYRREDVADRMRKIYRSL